ncbi:MAG TPA: hypothetical protein VHN18_15280 [Micromonosporaceae bacterium]|nr:hypothetical protein [Micromonosporaceae bacterium]
MAAIAASAVVAAGATVWEYGRRAGGAAPDFGAILFVVSGVELAATRWLLRRDRRADFRWRAALVLPDGVHPGLVGRWSRTALAIDTVAATGLGGGGLLFAGGKVGAGSVWYGTIASTVAGAAVIGLAVSVVGRLRRSGSVAVTSHGVAAGCRLVRWEQIGAVQRDKDGVHLRLRAPGDPRSVDIGGPHCAVSDERLVDVIDFYLAYPERRSALDTGPTSSPCLSAEGPRKHRQRQPDTARRRR